MDPATAVGLVVLALVVGTYGSIIGAGGGFALVAGLLFLFDLSGVAAVATSSIAIVFVQGTSALTYDRQGLVDRPTAAWFALGSVPVALFVAAFVAARIPQAAFELVIGVLLVGLALFVVFGPTPVGKGVDGALPRRLELFGSGSMVGVLSGAFGVGAGLVTVPLVAWFRRLVPHRAAATTSAIGTASGIAAGIGHIAAANPDWSFLPFLVIGAVIGGRLGASTAPRLSERLVQILLGGGLIAAGLPLLLRSL